MSSYRIPIATRPLRTLYETIGLMVSDDRYLDMTRDMFIGTAMKRSGGTQNPYILGEIYDKLMIDAGLKGL